MRHIAPLFAVALSLAPTLPASAANIELNRADWQVVVPAGGTAMAAVKQTCADGTLAASKSSVAEVSKGSCTWWGFNCKIPLSCIRMVDAKSATVSPVDSTVLELTVYGPFGGDKQYVLNRGHNNPSVAVRDPGPSDLVFTAPTPPPTTDPKPKPNPKPNPKPKPNPNPTDPKPKPKPKPQPDPIPTPKPKPPVDSPTTAKDAPLSLSELAWLTPQDKGNYVTATGATPAPTADALATLNKKTRETVAVNLRDEAREPYKTLVSGNKFKDIDPFLMDVKHYFGAEIELNPDEAKALEAVVKSKDGAGAGLTYANARLEYEAAMKLIADSAGHPKLDAHVLAHQITTKFRAMIPKKPGDTTGPPTKLSDAELAKLSPADRDAYNKAWDAAKNDDERRALNKTYSDKIAAANPKPKDPATDPKKPGAPFDPSKVKTLAQFNLLEPAQKQLVCAGFASGSTGGAAGECGDILKNADAATMACNKISQDPATTTSKDAKKDGATDAATLKARNDCMAKINACKENPSGNKPSAPPTMTKEVREACATFLAQGDTDPKGTKPSIGTNVPAPTDSEAQPKKKEEDKNFYGNLSNGMAVGIGAMILGSFFGGPLFFLAVGLVVGFGAYKLSEKINKPKDK